MWVFAFSRDNIQNKCAKNNNRLSYQSQSRASSSIVIVVTTHIDKLRKSQDLEALRAEICKRYNRQDGFPEIAGILEVTATSPDGTGIGQLREFIYESAVGMRIKKKTSGGSSTKVPFIGRMVGRIIQSLTSHRAAL